VRAWRNSQYTKLASLVLTCSLCGASEDLAARAPGPNCVFRSKAARRRRRAGEAGARGSIREALFQVRHCLTLVSRQPSKPRQRASTARRRAGETRAWGAEDRLVRARESGGRAVAAGSLPRRPAAACSERSRATGTPSGEKTAWHSRNRGIARRRAGATRGRTAQPPEPSVRGCFRGPLARSPQSARKTLVNAGRLQRIYPAS
jgi:hypothetical protein